MRQPTDRLTAKQLVGALLRLALATALPSLSTLAGVRPAASQTHADSMAQGLIRMQEMDEMLMRTREGSGTAWLPDVNPMLAAHANAGAWSLMLHGNAFVQYIREDGARGDSQLGSINWLMGMARRRVAGGVFGLRAMVSAEPWTIADCGYPILLATGETCDGEPLHDVQHQHDLFMELAAEYQRTMAESVDLHLYGAVAGEPALGPTAFPHRPSAMPNPLAPVSHHWFDGSHIAYGVVTAGVLGDRWKLEGSIFNGREPDEDRKDLDLASLNSFAGRVWWLPDERWALQASAGRLNEAEPGHTPGAPRVDVARYTASATHHQRVGERGLWASTAAVGRLVEEGDGMNAVMIETSVTVGERHTFFGRGEWTEKTGHDLGIETGAPTNLTFDLGSVAVGYTVHLPQFYGWLPGVGARGSLSFVPRMLEPFYGSTAPAGFTIFVNLRPIEDMMDMSMPMPMPMEQHR